MPNVSTNPYQLVQLADYTYTLPEEKIAQHPLSNRDASKLLHYNQGIIQHKIFRQLPELLPENSLLILNNTKVLPARLYFKKSTGAIIELFLLEPSSPSKEMATAMLAEKTCSWKCIIGNKKKWKGDEVLHVYTDKDSTLNLSAKLLDREENLVEFAFENDTFSEVLDKAGNMPLPPYMKRSAELEDEDRYQTVFSKIKGAVAAPTASLHFTDDVLQDIKKRGNFLAEVTLHVGAGTFQPIKGGDIANHPMHKEWFEVAIETIKKLASHSGPVIPIGTTACRTIESLYWLGVWVNKFGDLPATLPKEVGFMFTKEETLPPKEAMVQLSAYLEGSNKSSISCSTEIFIIPGYNFRLTKGLVTNFHQPESTLMLLIGALIGSNWKKVYQSALENEYRFLSYGDSSLLIP